MEPQHHFNKQCLEVQLTERGRGRRAGFNGLARGDVRAVQSPWRSLEVLQGQFSRETKEVRPSEGLPLHRRSPLPVLPCFLYVAKRHEDE